MADLKLVGSKFTKLNAERNSNFTGKLTLNTNIKIKDLEKTEELKDTLKISYNFEISYSDLGGVTIEGNIFINGYKGIFFYASVFNANILDNFVNNNSLVGIQISASSDNNITGNYVNGSTYGVLVNGSNFNTFSENSKMNHRKIR